MNMTCPNRKETKPMRNACSPEKVKAMSPTQHKPMAVHTRLRMVASTALPNNANPNRAASKGSSNPLAQSCTPFHSLGAHSDAPPGSSLRPNPAATNSAITTVTNAASNVRSARIVGSRLGPEFMRPRCVKKVEGKPRWECPPSMNQTNCSIEILLAQIIRRSGRNSRG